MRLFALLLLAAAPALAQPVTTGTACTYADCAIRLEQGFFGSEAILTGAPEQEIRLGSVGLFSGGLVDVVEQVPLALDHAQTARSRTIYSAIATVVGVAALTYGIDGLYDDDDKLPIYLGGAALTLVGGGLAISARRERARAVWEYNRAVVGQ